MEFTFQVASRMAADPTEPPATATPQGPSSDLDGHLALGRHAGAQPLPALDELRRLGVEAGEERGELLAGLFALGTEVAAVEHLPGTQDRADHLVVVQPE